MTSVQDCLSLTFIPQARTKEYKVDIGFSMYRDGSVHQG